MKTRFFVIYILLIAIVLTINVNAADNDAASTTDQTVSAQEIKNPPVAVVTEPTFETQPVIEGNDIVHTFVIKNTGGETLNISRVKTG
ncbi:MAG: hypothetical protein HQK75_11205 [Candidatus Magnetomorum sp.]|nr:hypothetical protein [Candidatus Magnetomorum sp.]